MSVTVAPSISGMFASVCPTGKPKHVGILYLFITLCIILLAIADTDGFSGSSPIILIIMAVMMYFGISILCWVLNFTAAIKARWDIGEEEEVKCWIEALGIFMEKNE